MGSEGPKAVTIHVTGFKKFQGVAENPTEIIVNNLKDFVERRGLPPGATIGICTILETAGDGALPLLHQTLESGTSRSTNNEQVVWKPVLVRSPVVPGLSFADLIDLLPFLLLQLHLGVNSGALKFAIEKQAVNEATFRCPDELGWQPQQLPIVSEDGGTSRARESSCCAEEILKFLKKKGFDVTISDDAGRFVCNYVYYHSLRLAEQKGHKSLFVHVPSFSRINQETQMRFVASLLEAIASTC